jgi:integrin beta 3
MPVMIYRGAWSADECYGQGDTVTWGGSTWHCNAATAAQPDEGVAGWTRQVRRGRDGKNGKDGERGPPGVEGRPGRDLMMEAVR